MLSLKLTDLFLVVHMLQHMFRKVLGPSSDLGSWWALKMNYTYGKSKTACNRRHLGSTPFALKETHSSSLPLNGFAISASYICSLMFG